MPQVSIFRKVALDRLSSPEQLDQVMRVTNPRSWLALLALWGLVLLALVWGVLGRIATRAAGEGVIVRTGSVVNVVTPGGGQVATLEVAVGDHLHRQQVVAAVAQPLLLEKIRAAEEALGQARRERERGVGVRREAASLQVAALRREAANHEREIGELQEQARVLQEQIAGEDQLLAQGLITRQQTFPSRKQLLDANGRVASLQAELKQLAARIFDAEARVQETEVELSARVAERERALTALQKELETTARVVSPYAGQVIELKVVPGATVAAGTPILAVQPDSEQLEVVVYLPSQDVKALAPGMAVEVSPSTVKREEFGYLRGRVLNVGEFPATPASVMRNFENQSLSDALLGKGPVNEVRVALEPDPATRSGYRWSSRQGPPLRLSGGTICKAQVVTREQRPLTLLLPWVQDVFGLGS